MKNYRQTPEFESLTAWAKSNGAFINDDLILISGTSLLRKAEVAEAGLTQLQERAPILGHVTPLQISLLQQGCYRYHTP